MISERSVELPWLLIKAGMPHRILDIGAADAVYHGVLFELCRELYCVDTRDFNSTVPMRKVIGSAHSMPAEWTSGFDLVTCISTLDHVGLDAYGNTIFDGLLELVVAEIKRVTAPGGRLLFTVPIGQRATYSSNIGGQQVFDFEQIAELFSDQDWNLESVVTWILMDSGDYVQVAPADVVNAKYLEWRAEAVAGFELVRLDPDNLLESDANLDEDSE